ncbi:hypothetical protein RVR_7367 [Actinacidiphila reveromycinica]|uniref:Uncharacterized protein n=1 Tax=Actinacidiphila reveromycinica TaxID=659352 RepID=A0A7U3VR49_9ACTN|nr:hypothetical protein [Streptomyces sp. SN-593]BBB00349.1 hypothetical protein RVR_7367 [Streptomyces sp. SN-593]
MAAVSYLRGFLPWIGFAAVSGSGWQWAALLALSMAVASLVRDRRAGVTADAQILDFGTIVFFGLLAAVAFADPTSELQTYESGLSSAWLALIAASSLLAGRPFTVGIAKRRTGPETWHTPVFRRTGRVLTTVWTVSFALGAVATFVCEATDAVGWLGTMVQILGFAVPAAFTHFYVASVRSRAASTAGYGANAQVRTFPTAGR